jgi:hypothetical protein
MPPTRTASKVNWGYASIWIADADTAEPASAATLAEPSGGTWEGVGFTAEGVTVEFGMDMEDITVEEQLTPVGRVATGATFTVTFDFAEDVIENRVLAMGFGSLATTAAASGQIGKKTLTLGETPTEKAVVIMAENGLGYNDRIYIPRMMAGGTVSTSYRRAEKRLYPVEYSATCDIDDIKIVQQTAAAS